jgi:hypothetical protein
MSTPDRLNRYVVEVDNPTREPFRIALWSRDAESALDKVRHALGTTRARVIVERGR